MREPLEEDCYHFLSGQMEMVQNFLLSPTSGDMQFLVMRRDMGMETMRDPGGMWEPATNPLPEWGRRDKVRGTAGRQPPFEDIH